MNIEDTFAEGIAIVTAMVEARDQPGSTDLVLAEIAAQYRDYETLLHAVIGVAAVATALAHWREHEKGIPASETLRSLAIQFASPL